MERCLVTVDGTDFRIQEPTCFDRKWFSHKFKGPGLRYDVAICIKTGDIVGYHGPFPCGSHNDLTIFRVGLKRNLGGAEKVIADRGYRGDRKVITPYNHKLDVILKQMVVERARHETLNGRFKNWNVLKNVYRHNLEKHNLVFRCVIVIEQISMQNGHPPFQITDYNDEVIIYINVLIYYYIQ